PAATPAPAPAVGPQPDGTGAPARAANRHGAGHAAADDAAAAATAAKAPKATISSERRAAVAARSAAIIDQPIHEPLPEAGVKDVVTSTDQNSVAAIATKRVAAISRPAIAAVTAVPARTRKNFTPPATPSEVTCRDNRAARRDFPQHAAAVT